MNIIERSAAQIARDVNARTTSAAEVTEAVLAHVATVDGEIGAYLTVLNDRAREIAAGVDARIAAGESLPLR